MTKNLIELLLDEITRVTGIAQIYDDLPMGGGSIAASLMEQDIKTCKAAISSGDVVEMLKIHEKLKGWGL